MAASCDKAREAECLSHAAGLQCTGIKAANHMQARTKIKEVTHETDAEAQRDETL